MNFCSSVTATKKCTETKRKRGFSASKLKKTQYHYLDWLENFHLFYPRGPIIRPNVSISTVTGPTDPTTLNSAGCRWERCWSPGRSTWKVPLTVAGHWNRGGENLGEETWSGKSLPGQRCSVSKVRKVLTAGASFEPSLGEATATNTHFTSCSQCFSRQRETVSKA